MKFFDFNVNFSQFFHQILFDMKRHIIFIKSSMKSERNSSPKKQRKGVYSMGLQVKPKDMLNLWLLNILPPSPSFKIKLNLKNMSIQGQKEACEKFSKKIRQCIQKYAFKMIQEQKKIRQKCLRKILSKFQCEIFQREEIKQTSEYLIQNYDFIQIKQFLKRVLQSNFSYLFCIKNQDSKQFDTYISELSQISSIDESEQNSFESEMEQQFSEQREEWEENQEYWYNNRNIQFQKQQTERKDEKKEQDSGIVFYQQYPLSVINKIEIQLWISKNRALKKADFKIIENKKKNKISISYLPQKNFDIQEKLIIVNRFFKFQKVLLPSQTLPLKDYEQIQKRFCSKSVNFLSISIISGYWNQNINENELRKKINGSQIKKTNKNYKEYRCILIEGFTQFVKQKYKEIKAFIENIKKQNIIEEINVNIDDLSIYFYEGRVLLLFKQVCQKILEGIKRVKFLQVEREGKKAKMKMEIENQFYNQFKKFHQQRVKKEIVQNIQIVQIETKSEVSMNLKKQFILLPLKGNSQKIILIEKKYKSSQVLMKILNQIRQNQKLINKSILFSNIFSCRVKEFQRKEFQEYKEKVKFIYEEKKDETLLSFACAKILAQKIQEKIKNFVQKLNNHILFQQINLQEDEFNSVYENSEKIKKDLEENYKLSLDIKRNSNKGCLVTVGNHITLNPFDMPIVMLIKRNNNLSQLPSGTLILFRNRDQINFSQEKFLDPLKNFVKKKNISEKEMKNKQRNLQFLYSTNYANIQNFISSFTPKNKTKFAFIMPKKNKKTFIINLLQSAQQTVKNQKKKIQIFVFDNSRDILKDVLQLQKGHSIKKWYVSDESQDFYYSEEGNKKIKRAEQRNDKRIILFNQDLNLSKITHRLSYQKKKLIHWLNQVSTDIIFNYDDTAQIILRNQRYTISKQVVQGWKVISENWEKQIQISLGIYEIDLKNNTQTNLFTNFQRQLQFKQYENQRFLKMSLFQNYNYQKNQVNIYYERFQKNLLLKVPNMIRQQINKLKIQEQVKINIDEYDEKKKQFIIKTANENKIKAEINKASSKLVLTGFDKSAILTFMKMLPILEKVPSVQFPETWQKQNEDIETFIVSSQSTQFKQVQEAFQYQIHQLVRIQNKPIYKKYFEEKMFLKSLNGGKNVKQMNLYHGTRTTNPKVLYEDKQECFNINYTSENNYLGKATYFAEKCEYSHNYSYQDQDIFQQNPPNQMLYCTVLVGESQKIKNVSDKSQKMIDTEFKDAVNKIRYESSTMFSNGSQIYAVYKNRRAYPLYLIKY